MHERDIALPLGIAAVIEPDELQSCLQYSAAVGPVLGSGLGRSYAGVFAVEASDPSIRFVLDIGESVSVRDEALTRQRPPGRRTDRHASLRVECLTPTWVR